MEEGNQKSIDEIVVETTGYGNISVYGMYVNSDHKVKHYDSAHFPGKGIMIVSPRDGDFPLVRGYVEVCPLNQERFFNLASSFGKFEKPHPERGQISDEEFRRVQDEFTQEYYAWIGKNKRYIYNNCISPRISCRREDILDKKGNVSWLSLGWVDQFWRDLEKLADNTKRLERIYYDGESVDRFPVVRINFKGLLLGMQAKKDQPRAYIFPYCDYVVGYYNFTGKEIPQIRSDTMIKFGNLSSEDWDNLERNLKESKLDVLI